MNAALSSPSTRSLLEDPSVGLGERRGLRQQIDRTLRMIAAIPDDRSS